VNLRRRRAGVSFCSRAISNILEVLGKTSELYMPSSAMSRKV
jgi:hypothetical protein